MEEIAFHRDMSKVQQHADETAQQLKKRFRSARDPNGQDD